MEKTVHTTDAVAKLKDRFSGRFYSGVGRRKRAVAQVRLYPENKGQMLVNGRELKEYFSTLELQNAALGPLQHVGMLEEFGLAVVVVGGGVTGQAESTRLGIARAILKFNADYRKSLKPEGMLRRDPRRKERKKPGLKRARRAPQWAKR